VLSSLVADSHEIWQPTVRLIEYENQRGNTIGKSGWFILIPIYNIVLFSTDSDLAPNQYGNPVK
jgi:hypothetical protein